MRCGSPTTSVLSARRQASIASATRPASTRTKYYRDWCNVVLAMGDMRDFVFDSRTNVNYWPVDVQAIEYVGTEAHDGPIRIVHSPNHPQFKGTRFIERAVAGLQRGFDVTLDLVQGVSNQEARRRYAEADIVFAQCIAGWIGYTELEAMAAGKPVITYIRNAEYLTTDRELPFVNATQPHSSRNSRSSSSISRSAGSWPPGACLRRGRVVIRGSHARVRRVAS